MIIMVINKANYFNALELPTAVYNYVFTENKITYLIIGLLSL